MGLVYRDLIKEMIQSNNKRHFQDGTGPPITRLSLNLI